MRRTAARPTVGVSGVGTVNPSDSIGVIGRGIDVGGVVGVGGVTVDVSNL